MEAKLLVVAGDADRTDVDLKLPTVIGRSREADITIAHPLVSRRHCEITEGDEGQLEVRDLGSLNGTFVGQNRVEKSALPPGALLTVGAITFRAAYGNYDENDLGSVEFTVADDAPPEPDAMIDTQIGGETEGVPEKKAASVDGDLPLPEVPDAETESVGTTSRSSSPPSKTSSSKSSPGSDDGAEDDFDLDWLSDDDS
jgi:predicted component of type VI protein secretion system